MSRPPETLTIEESEKLLTTLRNDGVTGFAAWKYLRNYTMGLLMLDAGLRVGEVVCLKTHDLIFGEKPVLALDMNAKKAEKKCERLIPTTERLQKAIADCNEKIWKPLGIYESTPCFFDQYCEEHISTRQVQRIIGFASLTTFGRVIHPHVLRHTFATRLMRVTSTSVVQQLLGHKNINSTQVYMHANGDDCKKAIDAISKVNIEEPLLRTKVPDIGTMAAGSHQPGAPKKMNQVSP